jgi:hypothetical protein
VISTLRRQILHVFPNAQLRHLQDSQGELLQLANEPFGLLRTFPKATWQVVRIVHVPASVTASVIAPHCEPGYVEYRTLVEASGDKAVEFLCGVVVGWRLGEARRDAERRAIA